MKKKLLMMAFCAISVLTAHAASDTITVRVKAMHCEHCGQKVKTALSKNPGVGPLEFNFERHTVKIAYDPQKTDVDSIYRSIAATKRYEATPYDPNEKIAETFSLRIDDMHCQKCVDRIAQQLNAIQGMDSIAADLRKHSYFIRYDANRTSQDEIRAKLVKAGYTPVYYYDNKRVEYAYYLIPAESANDDAIETVLALDGVSDVNVNARRKSMAITYLNDKTTAEKLLSEVQKAGIKAELPKPHECSEEEEKK
jgi:copper ion binding protein